MRGRYLYGVLYGAALTSVGGLCGAVVSFALCRWYDTGNIRAFLSSRVGKVDQLIRVIEGKNGFKIIMMLYGIMRMMIRVPAPARG